MAEIVDRADPPRLHVGDVAERLGVSESTVRRMVDEGVLRAVQYTARGHLRFRERDVETLLERAQVAA